MYRLLWRDRLPNALNHTPIRLVNHRVLQRSKVNQSGFFRVMPHGHCYYWNRNMIFFLRLPLMCVCYVSLWLISPKPRFMKGLCLFNWFLLFRANVKVNTSDQRGRLLKACRRLIQQFVHRKPCWPGKKQKSCFFVSGRSATWTTMHLDTS